MVMSIRWIVVALALVACGIAASAEGFLVTVTKETQAKLGVQFDLSAVRASPRSVLVRMEIPRTGKLKELKTVTMDIGDYRPGVASAPTVSAELATKTGKNGAILVAFQLAPEMAEKCSIRLGPLSPAEPEAYLYYAVELKGYITERRSGQRDTSYRDGPIRWGAAVRGVQLGAQIVNGGPVVRAGDLLKLKTVVRNMSGSDLRLSVGNYWKANFTIQVQTAQGRPIYMKRDVHNPVTLVAGYRLELLPNGMEGEVSSAAIRISSAMPPAGPKIDDEADPMAEHIALAPGRYRIRVESWGLFGQHETEPATDWLPIEVTK